jgi:putative glutamine amidotransferase
VENGTSLPGVTMKLHSNSPRRPTIGVTPDLAATQSTFPVPLYELKQAYAEAVLRAGGLPFLLPYSDDPTVVDAYLDRISGLLVTGGAFDIPPELYGDTAREGLGTLNPARSAFELAITKGALARNLPVFGICGGMQLLNVAMGGTLIQDLPRELASAKSHQQEHERTQPHHPIEVRDGTLLAEMLGKGQVMVNSTHHQSVKAIGRNVVVSAVAPDGVVEAIEVQGYAFAVGVQWHPEMLIQTVPLHLGLYKAFVQSARATRR